MDTERIREKLRPFLGGDGISTEQVAQVSAHIDLLLKWNARVNLTAVRSADEILTRHFGESLFAARQLRPLVSSTSSLLDIGSGAGFPGIPIKTWIPELHVELVESRQKKAAFLNEVVRAINVSGLEVVNSRAEEITPRSDLVTLRAVEKFATVLPIAENRLLPGGRLALLIGYQQISDASSLLPGFCWQNPVQVPLSSSRVVLIGNRPA